MHLFSKRLGGITICKTYFLFWYFGGCVLWIHQFCLIYLCSCHYLVFVSYTTHRLWTSEFFSRFERFPSFSFLHSRSKDYRESHPVDDKLKRSHKLLKTIHPLINSKFLCFVIYIHATYQSQKLLFQFACFLFSPPLFLSASNADTLTWSKALTILINTSEISFV